VNLSSFDFPLPHTLIAQHPLPLRDQSRLMVVERATGDVTHRRFRDLPNILGPGDFLVRNTTRVFPARLWATRPGKKGRIEILLIRQVSPGEWLALLRPARRALPGQELVAGPLSAKVLRIGEDGSRLLGFARTDVMEVLEDLGQTPLPNYIRRETEDWGPEDRERYQTVFADQRGSIAAPTAGLHFTPQLLDALVEGGVGICDLLLHVGYGTFRPIRCERVEDHRMDAEFYEISQSSAGRIRDFKAQGKRLVAVGTTTTRVLEYLAQEGQLPARASSGFCDLFIYPGFRFKILDGLITNFHLPRSTLFILVCAFAGRNLMLECYREAVKKKYRFFSYGDSMLIL
jgi:S-adenosylmethionine:tRNA ribosyltransferase-isomerase